VQTDQIKLRTEVVLNGPFQHIPEDKLLAAMEKV
jgi:hypothetical protein